MLDILQLFPEDLSELLQDHIRERWDELEEIRLRLHRPPELNFHTHSERLQKRWFEHTDCVYLINQLSSHSLYRMETELKEGYVTILGGHRVGLAGEVTTENGEMKQLTYITFFNIRIARQIKHIASPVVPYLFADNHYANTLLIGAPQTGKTTLIRDLARIIADGEGKFPGKKVGIVDERSEIAAALKGVPQHDVGCRTDVLDACPKVDGMMMMIRSMSPEVLVVDEIGSKRDVQALMEAIHAGVTMICTVHGASLKDIRGRHALAPLFSEGAFERFIILKRSPQQHLKLAVLDKEGRQLTEKLVVKQ